MLNAAATAGRPARLAWMAEVASVSALLLLALLVFLPGLHGPFLYDDFPNFLNDRAIAAFARHQLSLGAVLSDAHAGPLGRPLAVASLAWQMAAFGPTPFPFKLFNLLVHLLNAVLVYGLARQLFHARDPARARLAALLAAAAWAVHPLVLSPVLYVVQRMASLSAFGMLLALNALVAGHRCLRAGRPAWAWLWLAYPAAGLLGLLAKESAALLPFYVAVLATTVLTPHGMAPAPARAWQRFLRITTWLPIGLAVLAVVWQWPHLVQGFSNREFTLPQRLLTEARVVWLYLRLAVVPDLHLLGLFHDDVPLSTGWSAPATTWPAVLGLLLLAAAAVALRRRAPWFSFAVGTLLASQLLESTVVPLELMHEHRVYLGLIGLPLAAAAGLLALLETRTAAEARGLWLGAGAVVLLLAGVSFQRAEDWSNPLGMALLEAAHHPDSVRAQYDLATVYGTLAEHSRGEERTRLFAAAEAAVRSAAAADPRDSKPLTGLLLICSQSGCPIPGDTWSRLLDRFRHGTGADLMTNEVVSLSQCWRDHACDLPPAAIEQSFDALLANTHLSARGRGALEDEHLALAGATAGGAPP